METGSANGATRIRVKIVSRAEAGEFRGEPLSLSVSARHLLCAGMPDKISHVRSSSLCCLPEAVMSGDQLVALQQNSLA